MILGIILLGISACSKNDLGDIDDPNTPAPTQSDYDLYIHHSTANGDSIGRHLKGRNVDGRWKREYGEIYMGTDVVNVPVGTLTLGIVPAPSDLIVFEITSAVLSTANLLVGTSEELDARTYVLKAQNTGLFLAREVTGNFIIADSLYIEMERLTFFPEQEEETIVLKGTFTIVN